MILTRKMKRNSRKIHKIHINSLIGALFIALLFCSLFVSFNFLYKIRPIREESDHLVTVFDGKTYNEYEREIVEGNAVMEDEFSQGWMQSMQKSYTDSLEAGIAANRRNYNIGIYLIYIILIEGLILALFYFTNFIVYDNKKVVFRKSARLKNFSGQLGEMYKGSIYKEQVINYDSINTIELLTKAKAKNYDQARGLLTWKDKVIIHYQEGKEEKEYLVRMLLFPGIVSVLDYIHDNHKQVKFKLNK